MCIPPQSSCDADEVTVTERNGLPVDFGRGAPRHHPAAPLSMSSDQLEVVA